MQSRPCPRPSRCRKLSSLDERPLRDDGIALRLTGVLDDACAFIAGDEPQQADALPLRTIEPTHLTDREICGVCADPSRAAHHEHESVVRRRHVLLEGSPGVQPDLGQRDWYVIARGRMLVARRTAVQADLDALLPANGNRVGVNILKSGPCPPLALWQGQPQLEQAHLSLGRHVLAVNDAAAGGHPLHLARLDHAAFVRVMNRTFEEQCDRLEPRMRVRPADRPLADVQMVVHQHDEWIVDGEILLGDELCRQMPRTDESWSKWRAGNRTSNPTLRCHGGLRDTS